LRAGHGAEVRECLVADPRPRGQRARYLATRRVPSPVRRRRPRPPMGAW
jgi:hypothetical protein